MLLLYRKRACYKHGVYCVALVPEFNRMFHVFLLTWISCLPDFLSNSCDELVYLLIKFPYLTLTSLYCLLYIGHARIEMETMYSNCTAISFIN